MIGGNLARQHLAWPPWFRVSKRWIHGKQGPTELSRVQTSGFVHLKPSLHVWHSSKEPRWRTEEVFQRPRGPTFHSNQDGNRMVRVADIWLSEESRLMEAAEMIWRGIQGWKVPSLLETRRNSAPRVKKKGKWCLQSGIHWCNSSNNSSNFDQLEIFYNLEKDQWIIHLNPWQPLSTRASTEPPVRLNLPTGSKPSHQLDFFQFRKYQVFHC